MLIQALLFRKERRFETMKRLELQEHHPCDNEIAGYHFSCWLDMSPEGLITIGCLGLESAERCKAAPDDL